MNKTNNYNLKAIKEEFKMRGIFYTPPELAEFLKKYVDIETDEVYDPTCGYGSLLSLFDDSVKKYGQDINQVAIDYIKEHHSDYIVKCGDTLLEDKFEGQQFKVILANPPFSISYEPTEALTEDERYKDKILPPKSKADFMFIYHILAKLKDDGVAVALNFPGIMYRKNAEEKIRQWLVENNYIDKIVHIKGNQFVDTKIATVLLVLRKNKKTTDIEFIDTEFNKSRIVTVEEIKENNFNLSVSMYIEKEDTREKIDIDELTRELEELTKERIKKTIEGELFIIKTFGESKKGKFLELVEFIEKVCKDKKREYREWVKFGDSKEERAAKEIVKQFFPQKLLEVVEASKI